MSWNWLFDLEVWLWRRADPGLFSTPPDANRSRRRAGKRGYASKDACLTVLARSSRRKAMCRAYYCTACKRWHLTKMPKVNP